MIATDSITKLNTAVFYRASDMESSLGGLGLLAGVDPTGLRQFIDAPEILESPEGPVLSSMRNQLTVTIKPNALVFVDGSDEKPARDDFSRRVVQIAEYLGIRSGQTYIAMGLAFSIEASPSDQELPSRTILTRLVKKDVLTDTGYDSLGASARLWYAARDRMHDLRIEPSGNQYEGPSYFVGMTAHIALEGTKPSAEWLLQALNEEYNDFKRVLVKVLASREG